MKAAWTISSLLGFVAMLAIGTVSFAAEPDVIALGGQKLTELDMAETRGGFSLSDGGFITFSMDFLKASFLLDGQAEMPDAFFNGLSQRAIITDQGMQYDLAVLKGGNMFAFSPTDNAIKIIDNDIVMISDSFKNISGLSNIGIIAGDGNTMVNNMMLKVDIGFYGLRDMASFSAFNFMRQ